MKRLNLLYLAVFLMQYGNSTGWTGIPLVAQFHFNCSFWTLTLVGMSGPVAYTLSCLVQSRMAHHARPFSLMLRGAVAFAAVFALGMLGPFASGAKWLIALGALQAVMASLFWPTMEIVLAEGAGGQALGRRMGYFNIAWSLADAFGAATAGLLYRLWHFAPFAFVPVLTAAAYLVVLRASRLPVDAANGNGQGAADQPVTEQMTLAFRKAGWVANFFGFGVTGVIRSVFAAAAQSVFGMTGPLYGLAVATFNALRTLTFVVLGWWHGWHYRPQALLAVNSLLGVGMAGAVIAAFVPAYLAVPLVFVSLAAAGVGIGMTYTSSIFYSLSAAKVEDTEAHLHEAVLGGGSALFVGASGVITGVTGSVLAPLWMCAGAVALGLVISRRYIRQFTAARKTLE